MTREAPTSLSPLSLETVHGGGAYAAGVDSYYTAGTVGAYNAQRNKFGLLGRALFTLGHLSQY